MRKERYVYVSLMQRSSCTFIHFTFEAHVEDFLLQTEISGKYNSLFDLCFQFLYLFFLAVFLS